MSVFGRKPAEGLLQCNGPLRVGSGHPLVENECPLWDGNGRSLLRRTQGSECLKWDGNGHSLLRRRIHASNPSAEPNSHAAAGIGTVLAEIASIYVFAAAAVPLNAARASLHRNGG